MCYLPGERKKKEVDKEDKKKKQEKITVNNK